MGLRFGFATSLAICALASPVFAQSAPAAKPTQTAVNLHPSLLPSSFGDWHSAGTTEPPAAEPAFSLVNANKAALEESGPERSAVENYTGPGGRTLHVEAVEFKDASGALAAFSTLDQPNMHELKGLGTRAAAGAEGLVFSTGAVVAAVFPASPADLPALKALESVMPKPIGNAAQPPLLPVLAPARGLATGSLRYALGPEDYLAGGGVLPAAGLGWNQSAEAVTAHYADKRGNETLTLLLYPTPTIAGEHLRTVQDLLPGLGPSFRNAKARREGSLVAIADGSFSPDAAQALVENTHLHQLLSTDKAMPTPEVVETRQTFGLLANIILFSGLLGVAALGVGIFLGGGRALIRILSGKPAATEAEFLSLHLAPQNSRPQFSVTKPGDTA